MCLQKPEDYDVGTVYAVERLGLDRSITRKHICISATTWFWPSLSSPVMCGIPECTLE